MNTYYLTTRSKIFGLLTGAVVLALWDCIFVYFLPFLLIQVLIVSFVVFCLVSLANTMLSPSITISSNGIEYSQPFRTFKVNWDGIRRIGKRWFAEGLIVHSGYLVTLRNTFPPNIKAYSVPFLSYDFIPLSWFANSWRNSELGRHIKQYAPRLFDKETSA